jgi:multidrug efflux pump subunit AcrA (membrane-fusion protein)
MKNFNKWRWILGLGVLVLATGYYLKQKSATKAGAIQTFKVQKGELLQRVTIAGVIEALKTTVVTAPYDGYVQKIFVKIGDTVKEGDPLVSITQSLQATESVYPIRAPFGGTIVQVLKTEGQFVKQGDTKDFLIRLDDISKLYVNASVPEIDIVKIKKGQEAIVKASPILDRSYKGTVKDISLAATLQESYNNRSQAEYLVKLEILDIDEQLKPGMSTVLDIIPAKKSDILTVPHEYIDKQGEKYFVTSKDGAQKEIIVGMQNESIVEVVSGLKEGDEITQVDFINLGNDLKGAPSGSRRRR